jgi:spore coat protein CotF
MSITLNQKERMLLEDQKSHEQICIQKYNNYANQAQDPQLKQLFQTYAGQEQQHYNTINQILNGQVPNTQQGGGQQAGGQPGQQGGSQGMTQSISQSGMNNKKDAELCTDMLMTEKYVSGAYDTAIFEQTNSKVRQALNHIQKEEQQHGEGIFNYMQSRGMYNPQ